MNSGNGQKSGTESEERVCGGCEWMNKSITRLIVRIAIFRVGFGTKRLFAPRKVNGWTSSGFNNFATSRFPYIRYLQNKTWNVKDDKTQRRKESCWNWIWEEAIITHSLFQQQCEPLHDLWIQWNSNVLIVQSYMNKQNKIRSQTKEILYISFFFLRE